MPIASKSAPTISSTADSPIPTTRNVRISNAALFGASLARIGTTCSHTIGSSSRGGPGSRKMCGEFFSCIAGKYSPGAVPFALCSTMASCGRSACSFTRSVMRRLRRAKRSAIWRMISSSCSSASPRSSAVMSRVMSSVVGPRPPVTSTISARQKVSRSASRIASPSGTVVCLSMRRPMGNSACAIAAR